MNVNKGRSWELNTQGERDGSVTCKREKCRKSAQFRGAEVDEVNRHFFFINEHRRYIYIMSVKLCAISHLTAGHCVHYSNIS